MVEWLGRAVLGATLALGPVGSALARPIREGAPIQAVDVQGNRMVEDAAILAVISSKQGTLYRTDRLATDVRAIWGMGYFEDVQVDAEEGGGGVKLTYRVTEKPSVRKIIVGGNDEVDEIDLDAATAEAQAAADAATKAAEEAAARATEAAEAAKKD